MKTALDAFKAWLVDNRFDCFKYCEIRSIDNFGYGIFATQDINKGDVLFEIPKHLMISYMNALDHAVLGPIISANLFLKTNQSLCVALLLLFESESEESKWKAYIDVLPKTFEEINLPLFYETETLDHLKKSLVYNEIIRTKASLSSLYTKLQPLFTPLLAFTLGRFQWVISIIMSRQNHIMHSFQDGEEQVVVALIPMFDMFNHQFIGDNESFTFYLPQHSVSQTTSPKPYTKNEQILITYGKRSNQDMFVYSGFVCDEVTPFDTLVLQMPRLNSVKIEAVKIDTSKVEVGVTVGSCADFLRIVFLNLLKEGDKGVIDADVMGRVKEWARVRFELLAMNHSRILEGLVKAAEEMSKGEKESEKERNRRCLMVICAIVRVERDHLLILGDELKAATVEELVKITE